MDAYVSYALPPEGSGRDRTRVLPGMIRAA